MSQEGWSVDRFSEFSERSVFSVVCGVWCAVWWRSNGSEVKSSNLPMRDRSLEGDRQHY